MSLLKLFCAVDDFWLAFRPFGEQQLLTEGSRQRRRETKLPMSEIMTIIILFHQSGYRNFKSFCCNHVCQHLGDAFPDLVSCSRFVELKARALVPLAAYLQSRFTSGAHGGSPSLMPMPLPLQPATIAASIPPPRNVPVSTNTGFMKRRNVFG